MKLKTTAPKSMARYKWSYTYKGKLQTFSREIGTKIENPVILENS